MSTLTTELLTTDHPFIDGQLSIAAAHIDRTSIAPILLLNLLSLGFVIFMWESM